MGRSEHHRIDYVELTVTDLERAKRFYSSAFGWEFNAYGDSYAGIRDGDGEVGGLAVGERSREGGPLIALYSSALEDSLTAVERAGGTISTPPFSFPGGRRFQFHDPDGNELAVWSKD